MGLQKVNNWREFYNWVNKRKAENHETTKHTKRDPSKCPDCGEPWFEDVGCPHCGLRM